jgi:hypothetical protein
MAMIASCAQNTPEPEKRPNIPSPSSIDTLRILSVFFCFLWFTSAQGQRILSIQAEPYVAEKRNSDIQNLSDYQLYKLNTDAIIKYASESGPEGFSLHLDFSQRPDWTLVLRPSKVHDDEFKIVTSTGKVMDVAKNITYSGYLGEDNSVKIRATITDGSIQGRVYSDGIHAFKTIEDEAAGGLLLAIYKEGDEPTSLASPKCGNQREQIQKMAPLIRPQDPIDHMEDPSAPSPKAYDLFVAANGGQVVRIGPTVDWQAYFGKVNQDVNAFNIELQTMINYMNGHYESYGVIYQTTPVYFITASPNPWTDYPNGNGDSNRQSFGAWAWSSNGFPFACEVPLLFTGQDFGEISWASIGAMCQTWGSIQIDYHIGTTISTQHRSNIMSHEMGHVWGAGHVSGTQYYMSGSIYPGNLVWHSTSYSVISNGVQAAGCLAAYVSCEGTGDVDGDGICSDIDCDDNNADITTTDVDGDGICNDLDCDDNNASVTTTDLDGDGVCSDVDCDDNDPQITTTDMDGDGLCSDVDCDDTDGIPSSCLAYCIPEHVNCCNEYIESVSLNTLTNNSGAPLSSNNATGYSDYTSLSTTLYPSNTYNITVNPNFSFSASAAGVWIDWNDDHVFSSDENILSTNGSGPWTVSFTVPANAVLGTTRMRVRLQYGASYTPDPCAYSYYYNGETEDYSITLAADPGSGCNTDVDGDGICSDLDCDDTNAQVTTTDADGDGLCSDIDCDDNNAQVTTIDADGDGICSDLDCDDTNAQVTTTDADGDGLCSDIDCDDTDGLPITCNEYCIPEHVNCCNEYLKNVRLNTLNNSSSTPLHSDGHTGYSDYTHLSTTVYQENIYSIIVTPSHSFSSSKAGVWIDWNKDGVFSSNEKILSTGGYGPWTVSFTVPANAVLGDTRMRVRLQYGSNYTPDPCDYSYYYNGETEDYTIQVGTEGVCADGDPYTISVDADGDGLCSNIECNDQDAQVTTIDADGDGICGDEDCDDNDANITSIDADNDGVCSDLDCDDNNALITSIDADGDGLCSDVDCDDNNADITTQDADGDGICSNLDCDDNDGIPAICDDYCTPIHSRCCNERIVNVNLNTLNNSSGYPLHSDNVTGYSNYTALSTSLQRGNSYGITVTPSYSWTSSKAGVWIDWNQDQVFSNDENILSTGGAGPWAVNFTVPANANVGTTRMRVRLQYGYYYTPDPCDYSYYYNGETEDYSINVTASGANSFSQPLDRAQLKTAEESEFWFFPNPANDRLWINYHATKSQEIELSLMDQLGRTVQRSAKTAVEGFNSYTFDLHDQKPGVYFIRLQGEDDYQVKKVIVH